MKTSIQQEPSTYIIIIIIISIIISSSASPSSSTSPSLASSSTYIIIIRVNINIISIVWITHGSIVSGHINEVAQRKAQLVLGWSTVSWCGKLISVCNLPPRTTQPGHPSVGRYNEYRPKDGDVLSLGSKGRYSCVWWQVKLCATLYNTCHI